uniref:Uncharacterized protein n=1 Tax=Knipowitschia caucasica TaxID=637954 RepID=A0AAV2M1B5_KNICA
MQNDVGYTVYLIRSQQKEEAAGVVVPERHSKDSLQSFISYALSFREIAALLQYEAQRPAAPTPLCEDEQLVDFGARASSTWRQVWDSREDGYAAFILKRKCAPGTRMFKLQQYLQRKQQQLSASVPSSAPSDGSLVMAEDEELEKAMLSMSPTKRVDMTVFVPAPAPTKRQQPSGSQRSSLASKGPFGTRSVLCSCCRGL